MEEVGDWQHTYEEWTIVKYPEESWTQNSKEAGEWGDVNFGGWIVW